ncbi:hypothetical protein SLA2020_238920 [Shorea laevis]
MSMSISGTVVIRSPRGSESLSLQSSMLGIRYKYLTEDVERRPFCFMCQVLGIYLIGFSCLVQSSSQCASLEDASTSGTVVVRGQNDGSDYPRISKAMLGILERNSNASLEDGTTNLAEAKAARQAGLRKGNARERAFPRAHQANRDDEKAKIASSSTPLLIPSLKEALADDSEGLIVRAVTDSLVNMEHKNPGSCEALVRKLLERLASSKDSSFKEMQEMATCMFIKGKTTSEETQNMTAEAENRRRQQQTELHTNSNISLLARFLLSRWQSQVSKDLNPA